LINSAIIVDYGAILFFGGGVEKFMFDFLGENIVKLEKNMYLCELL
jgi:TM2 domain-containing membrane protein YozV